MGEPFKLSFKVDSSSSLSVKRRLAGHCSINLLQQQKGWAFDARGLENLIIIGVREMRREIANAAQMLEHQSPQCADVGTREHKRVQSV